MELVETFQPRYTSQPGPAQGSSPGSDHTVCPQRKAHYQTPITNRLFLTLLIETIHKQSKTKNDKSYISLKTVDMFCRLLPQVRNRQVGSQTAPGEQEVLQVVLYRHPQRAVLEFQRQAVKSERHFELHVGYVLINQPRKDKIG